MNKTVKNILILYSAIIVPLLFLALLAIFFTCPCNADNIAKLEVQTNTFTEGSGFKVTTRTLLVTIHGEGFDLPGPYHCGYQMLRDGTPHITCEPCENNDRCKISYSMEGYGSKLEISEWGFWVYSMRFIK